MNVEIALQFASAVSAALAAWFWFQSARTNPPPVSTGWGGGMRPDHPFIAWMKGSAWNNRMGAGFAGGSAVLAAMSTTISAVGKLPAL